MGKYIIDIDERYISKDDGIMVTNENGNITAYVPLEPFTECSGKELLTALRGIHIRMPLDMVRGFFDGKERTTDIIREFSAEDIVARYTEWKGKPEVGDEVINEKTGHRFVMVRVDPNGNVNGIDSEGYVYYPNVANCKKTGRHFDSVKKLLKEIGE